MTLLSMKGPARAIATLAALVAVATTSAQSQRATIAPYSEMIPMALLWGAESGDGRFYIASDALSDTVKRYDRITRRWETIISIKYGRAASWSPNGRFLAYARTPEGMNQPHIWLQPMDSATGLPNGMARRVSTVPGDFPAWSPDSRRISFTSTANGRLRFVVIPFNGGDADFVFEGTGFGRTAWSSDGRFLFGGLGGERLPVTSVRVNLATKTVDTLPPQSAGFFGYSPDGTQLGFFDYSSATITVAAADGRRLQQAVVPGGIRFPAWSRSRPGEITALQSVTRSNLFALALPGGQVRPLGPAESAGFRSVKFSPDGRRLAYSRSVDGFPQIFVANADGSDARSIGQSGDITSLEWAPTGSSIAYVLGSTLRLVELTSGRDRALVENNMGRALRWRSDGQAIQYVWFPRGTLVPEREMREVTLAGASRVLAQVPPSASTSFVGDSLVLLLQGNGVDVLNLRTRNLKRIYSGATRGDGSAFGVSSDGEWIAFEGHEGSARFPVLVSLKTGQSRRIANPLGGQSFAMAFHPNGRDLVVEYCITCANDVERWDVALVALNGDPTRVLTSNLRNYRSFGFPAISPDGSTLIFEGEESWNTRVVSLKLPGAR